MEIDANDVMQRMAQKASQKIAEGLLQESILEAQLAALTKDEDTNE